MASLRKKNRELAFQSYLTDGVKMIAEILSKRYGGAYFKKRYIDLILKAEEEPQSADDIKSKIKKKLGG